MEKDPELHRFASGTRRFEAPTRSTLPQVLTALGKEIRKRPYRRNQEQLDAGKKLSNAIMGERDD